MSKNLHTTLCLFILGFTFSYLPLSKSTFTARNTPIAEANYKKNVLPVKATPLEVSKKKQLKSLPVSQSKQSVVLPQDSVNTAATQKDSSATLFTDDCVSFNILASKKKYAVDDTITISIVLQLYNVNGLLVVGGDCQNFSLKVVTPKNFTQTGGDYSDYMNVGLSNNNPSKIIKLNGKFTSTDSLSCFILLKAQMGANSSTIFVKKKELCLNVTDKTAPSSTVPTTNKSTPIPVVTTAATNTNCTSGQTIDRDLICLGQSVTLTAPICIGGVSWDRTFNNTSTVIVSSTTNILVDTPPAVGTYSYFPKPCTSNQGSCPGAASITVTVRNGTVTTVTPPVINPSQACWPSNTTLTASTCSGVTHWYMVAYRSTDDITLFQLSTTTSTLSVGSNGKYFAKCESGCSLSNASNEVYLSGGQAPAISANYTSYCSGQAGIPPVTLTATGCSPWETVVWSNGSSGNTINVLPSITTTYTATCNYQSCSSSQGQITINLLATPTNTPTVSPANTSFCGGVATPTTITASGCTPLQTYIWSTGATTQSIVAPATNGYYTVRCQNSSGCQGPGANATVSLNAPTTPSITSSLPIVNSAIVNCNNSPFTISITGCTGQPVWSTRPHNSFTYTPVTTGLSPDGATVVVSNFNHVVYAANCQNACGATGTYSAFIVFYPTVGTVTATSNSPITVGSTLSLNATASNTVGSSTITYSWTGPNGFVSNSQNPTIANVTALATGTYTATVTNGQCSSTGTVSVVVDASCNCTDCGTNGDALRTTTLASYPSFTSVFTSATAQEFIVENDYLDYTGTKFNQTISYFDGLGRPIQKVSRSAGGNGEDILLPMVYDNYDRELIKYLPFAKSANNGNYRSTYTADLSTYYAGESNVSKNYEDATNDPLKAFSETLIEASPLNRVLKQGSPGNAWQPVSGSITDHVLALNYTVNTNSTTAPTTADAMLIDRVRRFGITTLAATVEAQTVAIDFYPANFLNVVVRIDENGNKSAEFKDLEGKVVAKRTVDFRSATDFDILETLYAYDIFNNLRFVFQPAAIALLPTTGTVTPLATATTYKEFVFGYNYDNKGRMTEKKVPGAGKVRMTVYDVADRLTTVIDANSNQLDYTYDNFDRSINTTLTNTVKAITATLIAKNTYDTYAGATGVQNFDATHAFSPITLASPKGQLTVSFAKIMDGAGLANTDIYTTYYYHPQRNLVVQKIANNHTSTTLLDKTSLQLDFLGRAIATKTTSNYFKNATTDPRTILTQTAYDFGNRMLSVCQKIDNDAWEPVVRNTYTGTGELKSKNLCCNVQTVDYKTNIRGWTRNINDINNLVTGKDLFAMQLNYVDAATNQYNGNIVKQDWKSLNIVSATTDNGLKTYNYTYDKLHRIKAATYTGAGLNATAGISVSGMTYDFNGNINTMQRTVNAALVDNMTYKYPTTVVNAKTYNISNQLQGIGDAGNTDAKYFNDANASNVDYTYDANGNMLSDANKAITTTSPILYNHLNLPTQITKTTGKIKYYYTAAGQKVRMEVYAANGTTLTKGYDYMAGGMVYLDDAANAKYNLDFIPTAEGRALLSRIITQTATDPTTGNKLRYEYTIKDHLGDLRVACRCGDPKAGGGNDVTKIVQEDAYDPWGLTFGTTDEAQTPTALTNRYTFLDREKQTDLGLNWQYLINRNYDYQTGRFMSVDPITEGQESLTTYQYAWDNPILKSDPNGDFCIPCATAVVGAVVGAGLNAYDQYKSGTLDGSAKSWGRIATAGLAGGIAGSGFGGLAVGAVAAAGGEAADQYISSGKINNPTKVIIGGAAAVGSGLIFKGAETVAVKLGFVAAAKSTISSKSTVQVVTSLGRTIVRSDRDAKEKVATATAKSIVETLNGVVSYTGGNRAANYLTPPAAPPAPTNKPKPVATQSIGPTTETDNSKPKPKTKS
jgi:RHS repeat-associated protein